MSSKHATIIPVPMKDGDAVVLLLQDWVLHKVYAQQFEDIVEGFIARCMNIAKLEDRERLLGFTVDWLLKCKEFANARILLRNYPVKDVDPEAADWSGTCTSRWRRRRASRRTWTSSIGTSSPMSWSSGARIPWTSSWPSPSSRAT